MRISSIIAKIEDRAVAAYGKAMPAVQAKAAAVHDEIVIRREAAKAARKFYAQVVAEVKAAR